jgi:hypothetical protein
MSRRRSLETGARPYPAYHSCPRFSRMVYQLQDPRRSSQGTCSLPPCTLGSRQQQQSQITMPDNNSWTYEGKGVRGASKAYGICRAETSKGSDLSDLRLSVVNGRVSQAGPGYRYVPVEGEEYLRSFFANSSLLSVRDSQFQYARRT